MDEGLDALREAIDDVDRELLSLLNRRMELALEIGRLKQAKGLPLFQPGREGVIFDRLGKANTGPLPEASLRSIYREIITASRLLQYIQQVILQGKGGNRAAAPAPKAVRRGGCAPEEPEAPEEPDDGLSLQDAAEK